MAGDLSLETLVVVGARFASGSAGFYVLSGISAYETDLAG